LTNMEGNALVINTASDVTEVAIIKGNEVFFRAQEGRNKTSTTLFLVIDELMKEAELDLKDLDYLGCVVGPGSFTGIRIGVCTIRTMAYVFNIKCVPVTYFDLLAYNLEGDDFAVITGNSNGVCYYKKGECEGVMRTSLIDETFLKKGITVVTDDENIVGSEVMHKKGDLLKAFYASIDRACDYTELTPLYLRKPQAEREKGDL